MMIKIAWVWFKKIQGIQLILHGQVRNSKSLRRDTQENLRFSFYVEEWRSKNLSKPVLRKKYLVAIRILYVIA